MTTQKPRYVHGCPQCEFLGGVHCDGTDYDVYRCESGVSALGPTYLARYGDDCPEYWSMPASVIMSVSHEDAAKQTPLFALMRQCVEEHER